MFKNWKDWRIVRTWKYAQTKGRCNLSMQLSPGFVLYDMAIIEKTNRRAHWPHKHVPLNILIKMGAYGFLKFFLCLCLRFSSKERIVGQTNVYWEIFSVYQTESFCFFLVYTCKLTLASETNARCFFHIPLWLVSYGWCMYNYTSYHFSHLLRCYSNG